MVDSTTSSRRVLIENRLYFFIEVLIVYFGVGVILIILNFSLYYQITSENALILGPLFYVLKAVVLIVTLPIMLYFSSFLRELPEQDSYKVDAVATSRDFLKMFSVKKTNARYQLLHGILLLFILFIPLDCVTYIFIPEMLKFQGELLISNDSNLYLTQSYGIFIISVVIIQVSVAIYEESLLRGFITRRGAQCFNKVSAVFISAFYFGLMHFAYILNPMSGNYPISFPIIWFLQAFLVGIVLALYMVKKKWILPLIMAHGINNIISAHAVWNYLQGNDFFSMLYFLYFPLLCVSCILLILQFSRLKESVTQGVKDLKTYFQRERKTEQNKGDVVVRILIDIVLIFLIFGVGLFFI